MKPGTRRELERAAGKAAHYTHRLRQTARFHRYVGVPYFQSAYNLMTQAATHISREEYQQAVNDTKAARAAIGDTESHAIAEEIPRITETADSIDAVLKLFHRAGL